MADGRIITFYSFKGGVGRTMALANVAYLAAHSGKRVLIMDWDLEAPGLAYYFRGFISSAQNEAIRTAPGVLNVLWDWSRHVTSGDASALEAVIARHDSGEAFEHCVRPIMEADFLPAHATLDFIGAGSLNIGTDNPRAYEQALSDFSWQGFFSAASGGVVIDAWRRWAKRHYDLILVDSRTGFADAAGVCTMQLPDEVALCFILNRQNIDGIANVSAAIRANSQGRIKLRAMPMRTARQDTSEESDAKARTLAELTERGGFSPSQAQRDMEELSVAAAENVPFYETLSPFAPSSPSLDLLSFNYRRLAKNLLQEDFSEPEISPALRQRVRQRLQHRYATLEYLDGLTLGDPSRLYSELNGLLDTAIADEESGIVLPAEYSQQLIEKACALRMGFDDRNELQMKSLDYLNRLYSRSPADWQTLMIQVLEILISSARTSRFTLTDEDCVLLEELDNVLATTSSYEYQVKRVEYKIQLAEHYLQASQLDLCGALLQQARALVVPALDEPRYSQDPRYPDMLLASFSLTLQEGGWLEKLGRIDEAAQHYLQLLENLNDFAERSDWNALDHLKSEALARLALGQSGSSTDRAGYAMACVGVSEQLLSFASRFVRLAQVVSEAGDADLLNRYLSRCFEVTTLSGMGIADYLTRTQSKGLPFFKWLVTATAPEQSPPPLTAANAETLAAASVVITTSASKKLFGQNSINNAQGLLEAARRLVEQFDHQPVSDSTRLALQDAVTLLDQRLREARP